MYMTISDKMTQIEDDLVKIRKAVYPAVSRHPYLDDAIECLAVARIRMDEKQAARPMPGVKPEKGDYILDYGSLSASCNFYDDGIEPEAGSLTVKVAYTGEDITDMLSDQAKDSIIDAIYTDRSEGVV